MRVGLLLQVVLTLVVLNHLAPSQSAAVESPWTQVVPAGNSPLPRRSHVSLLLELRDEIFIFGGISADECTLCLGGDTATQGKLCSNDDLCTGGGTCTRVKYCPMQDSWLFNILSFEYNEIKIPGNGNAVSAPAVDSSGAALWMPEDPDNIAALLWGGKTFVRSACPDTPIGKECFVTDVWKLGLGATNPQWQKMSSLSKERPSGRMAHSVNMLNGSMMMYGGTNGEEVYEDIWLFQSELKINSGRWLKVEVDHTMSPGPGRRFYHSSTFYSSASEQDGNEDGVSKVLVFGGYDNLNVLRSDLWELQVSSVNATAIWTSLDPSTVRPTPRAAHSTVLYNSQILILGGQGNVGQGPESVMFDSWVFDIALERWERRELRGTSVPRVAYHTQHFAPGPGLMFVLFGAFNRQSATNRIYVTNIETMQWQLVRPAGVQPSPRAGASAAAFGMDMVVFGGVSPRNGLNAETWWFYSQDLAWELVDLSGGTVPAPRSMHAYTRLGSYMLLHGGEGAESRDLADMWNFHAGSRKWQQITFPLSNAPSARHKHTATVVNERSDQPFIILFGGVKDEGTINQEALDDTWIFNINLRPTVPGGEACLPRINSMGFFDGVNDVVVVDKSAGALEVAKSAFGAQVSANDYLPGSTVPRVPAFTLEAWILVKEFQIAYQNILSIGTSVTIQRRNQRSFLSAEVCGVRVKGSTPVYDAKWHHVTLTVGSTRGYPEIILYVDEVVDVARNISADDMDDFDHKAMLRMGFGEGIRNSYFNGHLDDVRLWSRERTLEEVKASMWVVQTTEPALQGWWQFDKVNVDGRISDFSGKGRDGNSNGVARLLRPAIMVSTIPCDRPSFLSQKQLAGGSWTKVGADGIGGGGHRALEELVSAGRRAGGQGDERPMARHSHAAIPVSSTRIMIHGGISSAGESLSDLWMFDSGITIGNPWKEVKPVSTVSMFPVYGHHAVLWQKHSLIGYGAASKSLESIGMMAINANFGSRIMGMKPLSTLAALAYFTLVQRSDDRLLIFGGDVRHTAKGVVEDGRHKGQSVSNALYRTRRKSLEQFKLIEIPGKRPPAEYWGHSLVQVTSGLLCIFAGMVDQTTHSHVWSYDVTEGTWTQRKYSVIEVGAAGTPESVEGCSNVHNCKKRPLARFGHTGSSYSGTKVKQLPHGSGLFVIFGGAAGEKEDPFGDVTLVHVTKNPGPVTIYFNLANTGATSPGGLAYHAAEVFDDMLIVHGGVRKMKYDSSNQIWTFRFADAAAGQNIPLSGAWSQVSVSGDLMGPIYGHGMPLQKGDDSYRLWIVGGSTCVSEEGEDETVCANEEKFESRQEFNEMTTLYTLELRENGLGDYFINANGTMECVLRKVSTMSDESVSVPVPRINAAVMIVDDFMIVFGGATADAVEESARGWGDLGDLWGLRVILQGTGSQYRWRTLDPTDGEERPRARAGSSMIYNAPHLYIYGGANIHVGELSDMWRFNVMVAVPERSKALGDNLKTAVANEDATFQIDARTFFNNPIPECTSDFEVEFQSLQTTAFIYGDVIKTQLEDRCEYTVQYNIRKIGLFKVAISTMGRNILGFPSELNVRPGETADEISTAQGPGLSGCIAGMTCTFTILTRDVSGNQGKRGEEVRVILTGPCNEPLEDPITQVEKECSGPGSVTAAHQDSKDGTFAVSYTITATGNYSIHIKFGGSEDHIGGSPFRTLIEANSIEPSLSWIYGPGLTYSEAGLSSKFFVQTRDMFGNNISFQGADAVTPIFWEKTGGLSASGSSGRRQSNASSDVGKQLMQVGVRQVAREGGLFEIIFYPFREANGTLEVQVGASWSTSFPIAPRAVFQPTGDIEESKRLIIFAPLSSFVLGLVIALVINRVQASYEKRKQKQEEALAEAEAEQLKLNANGDEHNLSNTQDPQHQEEKHKKPEAIMAQLFQRHFVSEEEAAGIRELLANEDAGVLGAFDVYCDKPEDDASGVAVLAHQLKCILLAHNGTKES